MNKGMNYPCIANMHFNFTSTEAALLVNSDLKSIYSFNHLPNKYLLSACCMPNTVLGPQNTSVDKTEKVYSHELTF